MRRRFPVIVAIVLLVISTGLVPSVAKTEQAAPEEIWLQMLAANAAYAADEEAEADIGHFRRTDTAENGQEPYAVVITCSDSRVPAEHLFMAGIGDIFVIRTAGNVIGEFELGSIEYGAEHLGASIIVVLGHSGCGAVSAALFGHGAGSIQSIIDEIALGIGDETDAADAENLNIWHSAKRVMESEIIAHLVESGEVMVIAAKYDLHTGLVTQLGGK